MQPVHPRYRYIVQSDDNIAPPQTGKFCRTLGFHGYHENAAINRQLVRTDQVTGNRPILSLEAEKTTNDLPVADQPRHYPFDRIAGYGKADALCGHNHSGIDPDDFSAAVDQGPAGISGVERGIGLNNVFDQPPAESPQRTSQRTYNA